MGPLLQLTGLPALALICVWLCRSTERMARLVAVLLWLQVAATGTLVAPLLVQRETSLVISPDFAVDRLAAFFVLITQVVVAASMTHANVFFAQEGSHQTERRRNLRIFYTCAILFLQAMTAVFFCENLGFLWISVEATTLSSARLVYFHRSKHALEAAWKYLIICSVGIAFALFGTMFIFASSQYGAIAGGSLNLEELIKNGPALQYPLLRLGFLFTLLGYGTKAGIFPLHSWLPDAHSEAPAPASAMLSGGLLNCALFAIFRIAQIVTASGHPSLVRNAALSAGAITVFAASLFLIRQHGIKRLFAYSSIENVGLMLTAIGLGSGPLFVLLALNHSAAKVALFLVSGNIIQCSGSKELNDIRGLLAVSPYWSAVIMLGAFAVTGAPPFGAFAAEWQLLSLGSQQHLWILVALLVAALTLSFLAVCMHVGKMLSGNPKSKQSPFSPFGSTVVPACLIAVTLITGLTAVPKFFF
ncbi:MAG: hypothetical protein C5B53_00245 [Candidatus Melainabacteria bacterium]|nr:MAG: hypothetical protein C5B53_00245 [Candidatus Melainabacteria bacterium]